MNIFFTDHHNHNQEWQYTQINVPLKTMPNSDDGRVKWWRKKVRDNTCPPILVWYQNNIQTHVIVDGHARLQAYRLENVTPKVLIITAINHRKYDDTVGRIDALKGIKYSLERSKKPLDVAKLNELMVYLYKPQDLYHPFIRSKMLANFDAIWLDEVSVFKTDTGIDQDNLAYMMQSA